MSVNNVNRRNFLKYSAAAGAALALSPGNIQAKEEQLQKAKIPQRALGKTGLKVPILSMGVMRADNPSVVRAAYNSGIIHFDTAHGYQNGKNEEMLGEFFADKPRDSFLIATKVKVGIGENAAQEFLEKFELSMKRLRMDYVDILYIHDLRTVEAVNYEPLLNLVLRLKKEGRTKYIGLSTHGNEAEVINAAVDNGKYDVILTSYNYEKPVEALNPAIERAAKAGIGMVAMKTMAGGGYIDKERTQKRNTKAALKWALQNPNIHTAIPGYTSFDELEECLDSVAKLKFTKEEKEFLAMSTLSPSLYCQGCGVCIDQCTKRLPIPDMMRAYMYNYGYKSPLMAREVISELGVTDNPCGDCSSCKVTCTSGFQIAGKVKDITRLCHVPQDFLV